jgi:hypothetical protein
MLHNRRPYNRCCTRIFQVSSYSCLGPGRIFPSDLAFFVPCRQISDKNRPREAWIWSGREFYRETLQEMQSAATGRPGSTPPSLPAGNAAAALSSESATKSRLPQGTSFRRTGNTRVRIERRPPIWETLLIGRR